MNSLVHRVNRSSSTVKKAAEFLSAVMVLLAASVPLFSQAAVGTILGGVFDSSRRRHRRRESDDHRRGSRYHASVDDRRSRRVYGSQPARPAPTRCAPRPRDSRRWNTPTWCSRWPQDVRVDLTLSPGEQTQTVTVTAEAPAIDTTNATLGGTITNQSIVGAAPDHP